VFAFDYERNAPKKPRTDAFIRDDFKEKWRSVGHLAHLYGVLIAGTGFLRSLPDHKRENEFTAELHRQNHVGRFKAQMLLDLSRKFRPPDGITIAYEGYLG
jgi:hypothetical protein